MCTFFYAMTSLRQQSGILLALIEVRQAQEDADLLHIILGRKQRRVARRRRVWVRRWLGEGRRIQHGHFHRLMPELR